MIVLLVHENKASNGRDGLRGISGHGSLAGAVQTAIALSRPSPDDATLIGVSCTRAARKGFAPFTMRWSDAPCAHAPTGAALVATREADAGVPTQTRREKRNASTSHKAATERLDKARLMLEYLRHESHGQHSQRDIMMESGAGMRSQRAVLDAWAALCRGKFITGSAKRWWITEKGLTASESDIRAAAGYTAQFGRNPSSATFAAAAE
jgi:hypothetical protein